MTIPKTNQTNHILGYPVDARLLIINADDFGMCNAINEAIMQTLKEGVVRSTSLMVPCPWANQAMNFLKAHPEIPCGIHLPVICDSDDYSWGSVASKDKVPDLVEPSGRFFSFDSFHKLLPQINLDQLEMEFRSQIESVLRTGLKLAHLDWHAIRLNGQSRLFDLMFRLAREYELAFRIFGSPFIQKVKT